MTNGDHMPRKRALLVGIDDYVAGASLNGCSNDARAWAGLLTELYEFPEANTRVLLNAEATKRNITGAAEELVSDSGRGDRLVMFMACQGSYVAGRRNADPYERVLCPYDVEDHPLRLSELAGLTDRVHRDARLTMILDTSFYGTVTRAFLSDSVPGFRLRDHRRVRFYSPALLRRLIYPSRPGRATEDGQWNGLVIFAADHEEYAYEGFIKGEFRGAFSYFAIECLRRSGEPLTPSQLVQCAEAKLESAGYAQRPRVSGRIKRRGPIFD